MKSNLSQLLQPRVRELDILLFTRHLAVMIKSGIPLTEAIDAIRLPMRRSSLKNVLGEVLADLENGQSFSKALSRHPQVFDQLYTSLIEISEQSGSLDENLVFIAQQLKKNYRLKKKVQAASLYPTLVLIAAVLMGGFISFFVLPSLAELFEAFGTDLPIATQILLAISDGISRYGVLMIGVVIFAGIALQLLLRVPAVKMRADSIVLRLPFIGAFLQTIELARLTRNLGMLVQSGLPIIKSIAVVAHSQKNIHYANDLRAIGVSLEKGSTIATTMQRKRFWAFPPLVARMVAVGEKTGNLDESLLYLGDFYEEEIDTISKNISTIIEPALLLVIGLAVGFIALAIISPIYELTGSIGR